MFLFSKGDEQNSKKKDTLVFDYLMRIEKDLARFRAVYLKTGILQNQNAKNMQRQAIIETFEGVIRRSGGEMFGLANDDMVIIYSKKVHDEILACLFKVRFILQDDSALRGVIDLVQAKFATFYDLKGDNDEFRKTIRQSAKPRQAVVSENRDEKIHLPQEPQIKIVHGQTKLRRELTPDVLAKVQKVLAQTDFSNLIRRQSICAIIGKSLPQLLFDEVYVSIADMRDSLLPDVDLTANPWLFQNLTETLDKRVLVNISQHDDGSLKSNFSMNLNVSTVLSDDFLAFDDNVSPLHRSSIVLELQLVDILSDIKAFMLAKTFAQYRGYRICIDAISVDKLEFINKEFLGGDLMKIIWDPAFESFVQEHKYFSENMDPAERAKIILCRIDDPKAIEIGNSLGINMYQGRLIQKMMNAQPRKTIYKI